jgi:hypothetical protein
MSSRRVKDIRLYYYHQRRIIYTTLPILYLPTKISEIPFCFSNINFATFIVRPTATQSSFFYVVYLFCCFCCFVVLALSNNCKRKEREIAPFKEMKIIILDGERVAVTLHKLSLNNGSCLLKRTNISSSFLPSRSWKNKSFSACFCPP